MFIALIFAGCSKSEDKIHQGEVQQIEKNEMPKARALMASRFSSFDDFKKRIKLDYVVDTNGGVDSLAHYSVFITYEDRGNKVVSVLESGITQGNIIEVRDGDMWDRAGLVYESPFVVANRVELNKIYKLARRRPTLFGVGDVAFYDLAQACVEHISTDDLAYLYHRDSSDKGFINTFNHVTAQALITTMYSEEIADFVADVHERYSMPELITGKFTETQLTDLNSNPVDNYVDLINNEIGQELGLYLKDKYQIDNETIWTPVLLASYLNDMQEYYSWAFEMGLKPFNSEDEIIVTFCNKIKSVKLGVPYILE